MSRFEKGDKVTLAYEVDGLVFDRVYEVKGVDDFGDVDLDGRDYILYDRSCFNKVQMGKPHKHAELIKAWADGATIELRCNNGWSQIKTPSWDSNMSYRIACELTPAQKEKKAIKKAE